MDVIEPHWPVRGRPIMISGTRLIHRIGNTRVLCKASIHQSVIRLPLYSSMEALLLLSCMLNDSNGNRTDPRSRYQPQCLRPIGRERNSRTIVGRSSERKFHQRPPASCVRRYSASPLPRRLTSSSSVVNTCLMFPISFSWPICSKRYACSKARV